MKDKKVVKLINELLDEEANQIKKREHLIIAKYITKNKGRALYYNPESGWIAERDIDFRDTHKFETDTFKLMRFRESYLNAAKATALCYMKDGLLGYGLYSEDGIIVG